MKCRTNGVGQMHRAAIAILVLGVIVDVLLDHLGNFHFAHFRKHPLLGRWQPSRPLQLI